MNETRQHMTGQCTTPMQSAATCEENHWHVDERAILDDLVRTYYHAHLARDLTPAHQLHACGTIASRKGHLDVAVACLGRATALDSRNAPYWTDLGDALMTAMRSGEAVDAYRRAAALTPTDPEAACRLGRAFVAQGDLVEALACYEEAKRRDPRRARTRIDLGDARLAQGNRCEARRSYEQARDLDPNEPDAYHRLGRLLLEEGEWAIAAATFRAGLQLTSERAELYLGLAEALFHLGALESAHAEVGAALMCAPRGAAACQLLIAIDERLGRHADAVAAWSWLGEAYERSFQFDAAIVAHRMALASKPDSLRALVGLGHACMETARPGEAIPCFEKAIALQPQHARAHQCLGWSHAHMGNLRRNWEEIAWYDRHAGPWQRFEQPTWDGSPLDGRTILLWSNAALGDTIQMARFARVAKARGGRVVMECFKPLLSLFASMSAVDEVIPNPTPLPAFDAHALLASLPGLLGTNWEDIPADVPYLSVPDALRDRWRQRLGPSSDFTVGLVWGSAPSHGDTRVKSTPLAAFAPLATVRGVRFVSLQLGPQTAELLTPPAGLHARPLLDPSSVVADTAALILNLDLVISIDTMVAHLAGALGRPVWTLLHHAADWRWRLAGDRSPWYPTMRLFRQSRPGHWRGVLDDVRDALAMELVRRAGA